MDDLELPRTCARCRRVLPTRDFPLRRKDGIKRYGHCRDCKAAYQRQWYERNRNRHVRAVNDLRRERRRRNRRLMDEAKNRPCADCGQMYPPYVMDFDHVRGTKLGNVSEMVSSATTLALLAEIAKCDVVCANCHRLRTHCRRHGLL